MNQLVAFTDRARFAKPMQEAQLRNEDEPFALQLSRWNHHVMTHNNPA
jgi:hypothetical protein